MKLLQELRGNLHYFNILLLKAIKQKSEHTTNIQNMKFKHSKLKLFFVEKISDNFLKHFSIKEQKQ